MDNKDEEKDYLIWVDWEHRIISFQMADGFEQLRYASYDEMFQFAIQKGYEGFGIQ